ncbi:MAG: hypothetical protein OIN85_01480 [Candidatus Methanoperedens sp.]|nr:hypothetical protein [Candidatus Methanoperedens sp.]
MSVNYELLRKLYPEWESPNPPFLLIVKIFLIIVLFLIIPYIYIKCIEGRLSALMEKIRHDIGAILYPPNTI